MKFVISREDLLKPLQLVAGVVERRQTLPVLSNVLLVVDGNNLSLTGTDLEVELIGRVHLEQTAEESGEITIPAKKLMDICKSLPDKSEIKFKMDNEKIVVQAGRSRFSLSTLPATEFPNVEHAEADIQIALPQSHIRRLIDSTGFAMAHQDVRYYLNGMLLEVAAQGIKAVATDGHRLATCSVAIETTATDSVQVIVPRKGVLEIAKLMTGGDTPVEISLGSNHIVCTTADFTFTSKLVDGKFPDYDRVIPKNGDKFVYADRQEMRQVFSRTAILSNEKYRGIRLVLTSGNLQVFANNPEQEEAEESMVVDYQGESIEVGFNVSYLQDVLSVIDSATVKLSLFDANSSALVEEADGGDSMYVVMPMRL
jgi:DNA polymerase-3 subunit beta